MPKPLVNPNLPSGKVLNAIVSGEASENLIGSLKKLGIDIVLTERVNKLSSPVASHADIQMVNVCEGVFLLAPEVSDKIRNYLTDLGFDIFTGGTPLGRKYPQDVPYNCAVIGKFAILNTKYTDPILLDLIKRCGIKIIDVRQGYAKCSTCIISDEAVITADLNIHNKSKAEGIDSLFIPSQKNICLKGYDYGFIGGASGMISEKELGFFGSVDSLNNAGVILDFLKKYGIGAVSLTQEKVVDLGGLIPLCSE